MSSLFIVFRFFSFFVFRFTSLCYSTDSQSQTQGCDARVGHSHKWQEVPTQSKNKNGDNHAKQWPRLPRARLVKLCGGEKKYKNIQ